MRKNNPRQPPKIEAKPAETEGIEQAVEILRPLLKDAEQAPRAAMQMVAVMEMHSGPLPPPALLDGYEKVIPGSAREILEMAKLEQAQRHLMTKWDTIYLYFGLLLGFFAFSACLGCAMYLATHDQREISALFLGVPVLAAVGWFINGRLVPKNTDDGSSEPAGSRRSRK